MEFSDGHEYLKMVKHGIGPTWFFIEAPRIEGVRYRCPCCNYKTLEERGRYDICPVCFWEDDGQDSHDADKIRGGPNGRLSLTKARENYRSIGACEERLLQYVRSPLPEEL